MTEKAIIFDSTKCIACRACQVACKQWNELSGERTSNTGSYENPRDLSPQTWLKIRFIESEGQGLPVWIFTRQACMHCTDAACIRVCPTKALYHNAMGMVSYNKDLCSGCGYCVDFCPFHVPRSDRNLVSGQAKMDKCTMCTNPGYDRITAGYEPACVKTCPPLALQFGDREQLVKDGANRVQTLKTQGFSKARLYGANEMGGMHVLYVLADSPEIYGLPANPQVPAIATAWKGVLQPVGLALGGLTMVGLALNFMVAREAKIARELPGRKGKK